MCVYRWTRSRCAVINLPSRGKLNHYLEAASKLRRCMLRGSSPFHILSPLFLRPISFFFFLHHCSCASFSPSSVATSASFLISFAPLPRFYAHSSHRKLPWKFLPRYRSRASRIYVNIRKFRLSVLPGGETIPPRGRLRNVILPSRICEIQATLSGARAATNWLYFMHARPEARRNVLAKKLLKW